MFWVEVSCLRQYAKDPWQHVELWLTKKWSVFHKPERRCICKETQAVLRILPWAGDVFGFTEKEPVMRLAEYLSDEWLTTVYVNQQLDLLGWDLLRSGTDPGCEVVNLAFFIKVLDVYHGREMIPYNAERRGVCNVWAVGEELSTNTHSKICGIVNIEESHWVAVAVDIQELVVWYGDSLVGSNLEVCEALEWWINQHIKRKFCQKVLPITNQINTHSCAVLALNAVRQFCLPNMVQLAEAHNASYDRVSCFNRVAKHDLDNVSAILLLSCL